MDLEADSNAVEQTAEPPLRFLELHIYTLNLTPRSTLQNLISRASKFIVHCESADWTLIIRTPNQSSDTAT